MAGRNHLTGPTSDPDHELTWRQQKILHFIRYYAERRGYMPSLREIGEAAELASTSSVSYQLTELQRKGYLRRTPGRPRSIELRLPGQPPVRLETQDLADAVDLPPQDPASVPVPLYGQIAAGPQNLTERIIGDTWDPAHRGHLGSAQGTRRRRDTVPPPSPR